MVAVGLGCEAEAIGANDGSRVDDAACADLYPVVERGVGVDDGVLPELHPSTDVGVGVDERALADACPCFNNGEGSDRDIFAQRYALGDSGLRGDALGAGLLLLLDQLHELG